MSEQKQPKVRFSGFDDDWEQHKLGEVFSERLDRTSTGELISVTINNGVVKSDSLNRKDNSSQNKSNYKKVNRNDIAYNSMRMWQGASGVSQYEGILSPAYTVLIPNQVSSVFFSFYFKKEHMKQTFQKYSQGLTSDTWNLKYPQLKLIHVLVPAIKEQNKIANLLSKLDSRIAANQRQLEELKTIKKLAMQKIFDQEWRFNGFTDAWEQRKFESFSGKNSGGGTPSTKIESYWNGKTPWIQSSDLEKDQLFGVVPQKYISKEAINNSATKIIPANSIAVVTRVAVGKVAFMSFDYATSQDFLSLVGLHVNALFGVYDIFRFMKGESKSTQGTSIKGITKNEFLNSKTFVPETEKEQLRIGELLANIDNLIAANQRQPKHVVFIWILDSS